MKIIADNCNGSARKAIVMLNSIRELTEEEAIKEIKEGYFESEKSKHIGYLMLYDKADKQKIISNIKEILKENNPEGIRIGILNFLQNQYMKDNQNDNMRNKCAFMIDCFSDNYYDTGVCGLLMSIEQFYQG